MIGGFDGVTDFGANLGSRPFGTNVDTNAANILKKISGITDSDISTTPTPTGSKIKTNVAPAPTLIEQVSEEQFIKNLAPGNTDVAAFRQKDNAIVINVNAPSVIDETGFTRAVQLAIQNTQQRGGGGGGFALIQ